MIRGQDADVLHEELHPSLPSARVPVQAMCHMLTYLRMHLYAQLYPESIFDNSDDIWDDVVGDDYQFGMQINLYPLETEWHGMGARRRCFAAASLDLDNDEMLQLTQPPEPGQMRLRVVLEVPQGIDDLAEDWLAMGLLLPNADANLENIQLMQNYDHMFDKYVVMAPSMVSLVYGWGNCGIPPHQILGE